MWRSCSHDRMREYVFISETVNKVYAYGTDTASGVRQIASKSCGYALAEVFEHVGLVLP